MHTHESLIWMKQTHPEETFCSVVEDIKNSLKIAQNVNPWKQELSSHFSRVRVQKQTIRIIIGV